MINVDYDASRVIVRLGAISERMHLALVHRSHSLGNELQRHAQADQLSLRVRTVHDRLRTVKERFGRPVRKGMVELRADASA